MNDKGLGKGLDALFPEEQGDVNEAELKRVPVDQIEPDPDQPRQHFDEGQLQELTQSIEEQGLVEPVVLRPHGDGFMLVAGERRWRASCQAGLDRIPALVRELNRADALAISVIENIQRENLTVVEEARAYRRLMDEQDWNQQELADNVGRSRSAVANTLRLLKLPDEVLEGLNNDRLTSGHARALLSLDDDDEMLDWYHRILEEDWTVRETEKSIRNHTDASDDAPSSDQSKSTPDPATDFSDLEASLESSVGAPVTIESRDRKKGYIKIHFSDPEEFESIQERLSEQS